MCGSKDETSSNKRDERQYFQHQQLGFRVWMLKTMTTFNNLKILGDFVEVLVDDLGI